MFTYILLATICGAVYGASIKEIHQESRILEGQKVNIKYYPHHVGIYKNNGYRCGGAIIDSNHIITAAHCMINALPSEMKVFYGLSNTNEAYEQSARYTQVERIFIHQNFTETIVKTIKNDIAILRVDPPIEFSDRAQPIAITNRKPQAREILTITGFGYIGENLNGNGDLLAVGVPTYPEEHCRITYRKLNVDHINEEVFCAGFWEGKKDSCQGDSGSPVISNGKLVGIVSFGIGCGRPGIPGVYANVANYIEWIAAQILCNNHYTC